MAKKTHSFIDIAVLDGVRELFLQADALVLLSTDLQDVLWANGQGAALLRLDDIEQASGAPANIPFLARRQIAALPGFPRIEGEQPAQLRLTQGGAAAALLRSLALPSGEEAILLRVPAPAWLADDRPARTISGIAEAGHFAALLDEGGGVLAASGGFDGLGIAADELAALTGDARHEPDRLAKRLVIAAEAAYPAGIARLADDPARYMIVIVDDPQPLEDLAASANEAGDANPPAATAATPAPAAPVRTVTAGDDDHDNWYFSDRLPPPPPPGDATPTEARQPGHGRPAADEPAVDVEVAANPAAADEDSAGASIASLNGGQPDEVPSAAANDYEPEAPAPAVEADGEGEAVGQDAASAEEPKAAGTFEPDLDGAPVRFVWRTDAQGRFSALSGEFAGAVGPLAADVVGRPFRDVARQFGLDPDGEIAGLLERRDTWSGRTVLWPVQDTGLRVPVDLAALPVYARDRSFEGFRGFGVARLADAATDPDATGRTLRAGQPAPVAEPGREHTDTALPQDAANTDAGATPDPFRGETPAISREENGPARRHSDKVIRLAEHRAPAPERELSSGEKLAFAEIGARLKDAQRDAVEPEAEGPAAPEADAADDKDVTPATAGPTTAAAIPGDAETPGARDVADVQAASPTDLTPEEAFAAPGEDEDEPTAEEPAAESGDETADVDTKPSADEPSETDAASDDFEGAQAQDASAEAARADVAGAADVDRPDDRQAGAEVLDFAVSPTQRPVTREPGVDTSILERLPVPVLIHSGDALHYANEEFFNLTGYHSVEQLEYSGGLGALFVEADDDASDGPDHRRRLRTRTGEEFPVEALLQSVPWDDGKALLLAIKPAGQRADAGQMAELEARVEEMRTILDTATDGIVILARDGTIRSISRPAEALFGFDSETVAGKHFVSLFAVESQRAARDYLNGLSDHGVASVLNDGREVIGREAMGRFIPLFMTIGRLPGDSGYCAVLRDITQWKRAEEELTKARAEAERSSSQKTEFLARISHEIRTPLNAIIGFSELMIDEKFGPIVNERYRDYLRDINRSGNHVLDLVNDLLDISKIEAGEQELSYEAVSLNEALAEAVAMMQPQANRDRVIIRSSYASRLPEVVADLRSVRQIALNLLSNAVRYTQAGGQVIVSTAYEPSGDVVMRVRDTGIGMSQGEIEQALKPFRQINALKRARGDGTGLGLPLTKAMVEANRARFAITSAPGEGTLVEIVFPSTRVLAG